MAGSMKSAIVFAVSGLMFLIQMGASIAVFDDAAGAILAFAFVIIMFAGSIAAWKGGLSAVMEQTSQYAIGGHTRVTEYRDTGQSIQCTPCFGICGGIGSFIVVYMIGAELFGTEMFLFLTPGILGGILGIVAAVIFILDYKGPWTLRRF